jgi:hypothetical protein
MYSISVVDYCSTKKIACLTITTEFVLDVATGRNYPDVQRGGTFDMGTTLCLLP